MIIRQSGFKNYVNHKLILSQVDSIRNRINYRLILLQVESTTNRIQPMVESTYGRIYQRLNLFTIAKSKKVKVKGQRKSIWHFTRLKCYSVNTVALYQAKVPRASRIPGGPSRASAWAPIGGYYALASWKVGACELEAESWDASWSWNELGRAGKFVLRFLQLQKI